MKKFMISIAAICAVIFFVSCGGNSSDKKDDSNSGNNTEDEEGGNNGGGNGDETDSDSNGGGNGDETDSDSGNNGGGEGGETNDDDNNGGDNHESDPSLYEKFIGRWAAEIILHSTSSTSLAQNVPSITTRYVLVDFYVNDKGQLDMKKIDNPAPEEGLEEYKEYLCRTDNRTGAESSGGIGGIVDGAKKGNVLFNAPYKFNTVFYHWKPYEIPGDENVPYVEVAQNGNKISFKLNKDWELRGAKMKNPAKEEMPTKDNDERIFNQDNDFDDKGNENPAFTIGFKGFVNGDIFYVQRLSHIFAGELVADGKINGKVEWTDEQYAHQSTKDKTLKGQKTTVTHSDKSIFQFIKVADDMNCDTMLGQLDTIFDLVDPYKDDAVGKD